MIYDYAVIGLGMMGSSLLKHLAIGGHSVVGIGQTEPADIRNHEGVYSSHYDQGRITRRIDRNPHWARMADLSIKAYPAIEAESGIKFHHPSGSLLAGSSRMAESYFGDPGATSSNMQSIDHKYYPPGDRSWMSQVPEIHLPDDYWVMLETGGAGWINPRLLVSAQLEIAQSRGATLVRQTVVRCRNGRITTAGGDTIAARQVIVATGAFVNFLDVLNRPVPVWAETETYATAELDSENADALQGLPTLIYTVDAPQVSHIYLTPPTTYPDGRTYLKIGADTAWDLFPSSMTEVKDWFSGDACVQAVGAFTEALEALFPNVAFGAVTTHPCILARTHSKYPFFDRLDDETYLMAGGNGGAAKSCDAMGALVAADLAGEPWPEDLPRESFRLSTARRWHPIPVDPQPTDETYAIVVSNQPILVGRDDDGWWAIGDRCSHAECAFSRDGEIVGSNVVCNCHGAEFDLRTGAALALPATRPIDVFPIRQTPTGLEVEL